MTEPERRTDTIRVTRIITVTGPRDLVEKQLARCWLQPGIRQFTGTSDLIEQIEIHRSPAETLDD